LATGQGEVLRVYAKNQTTQTAKAEVK